MKHEVRRARRLAHPDNVPKLELGLKMSVPKLELGNEMSKHETRNLKLETYNASRVH